MSRITPHQTHAMHDLPTWQTGILQSSVHRQTKKLTDDFLQRYNLSAMHWLILGAIYETGDIGLRVTDLAENLGTTLGYLTTAVNMLEAKGLVERCEHCGDNRVKILVVVESKRALCAEIEKGLRELFQQKLYSAMSRKELDAYFAVLQKIDTMS